MTTSMQLTIQFNGKSLEIPSSTTVAELLHIAEVRSGAVAVEVNEEIVPHDAHRSTLLRDGDVVEAVTLVGGG